MSNADVPARSWLDWTLHIKVWKLLLALILLPLFVFWMMVVHQEDEILALSRNEVVTTAQDIRTWHGAFFNKAGMEMRDVAATVHFLDSNDQVVGEATAEAAALPADRQLTLQAPLPAAAVKLRIYSVQWRSDSMRVLVGPFREPWQFGYLQHNPNVE